MHEYITILTPASGRGLDLWFEPWAEGLEFSVGASVGLHAVSSNEGKLEIVVGEKTTTIYGWAGSTLKVVVGDAVVHDFDWPVPEELSMNSLSVKETMARIFGSQPVLGGGEKPDRPWWRFWA